MISNKYDFAIIGGDLRQVYMASSLTEHGFSVIVYGLNISLSSGDYFIGNSLKDVMKLSQTLITSIPFSIDNIHVKSQNNPEDLTVENFANNLDVNHKVYGGSFSKDLISYFNKMNIYYLDLMKKEEIIIYNSIATAEGAIAEGIKLSTINLHNSSCVILGFGRCGKTLSIKLSGFSNKISIAVRSSIAKTEAYVLGFNTIEFNDLESQISKFDFIFNTVPDIVLTPNILDQTKQDVTIIDIASSPGGVDYDYAGEIGRNANLCLGLPGKYAPKSSGQSLIDCILRDLRK